MPAAQSISQEESAHNERIGALRNLAEFVPPEVYPLENPQTDIPRIAKDERLVRLIEEAVRQVPTSRTINFGDARGMNDLDPASVHLVVTSPPYWTLKEYRDSSGQMGHIDDYEAFLGELDKVWAQMNGFVTLIRNLLCESGLPEAHVYCDKYIELPGWYRPEKKWDLLVVADGRLLAGVEFKSQVGSFGNNYNNRTEEAIGSATDIWAAYREGAFKPSARPWLGYLMLLEEAPKSLAPVRAREPHFKVFPEFKAASYAKRYEILLTKLVRERLYDAACFLVSSATDGPNGAFRKPAPELSAFKTLSPRSSPRQSRLKRRRNSGTAFKGVFGWNSDPPSCVCYTGFDPN